VYAIPYVDVLHVFEMPLLGYAGYLPFGLACAATGDFLLDDAGSGP
jgi:recombinational DNA repair protein (RecF pathway)